MKNDFQHFLESLRVRQDKKISLKKDFRTNYSEKIIDKKEGEEKLAEGIENIARLQDKLYAYNGFSILIILQAMDAAGKDSAIKHVMSSLNPRGVQVTSFKVPSAEELSHDFLWRHVRALPPRGQIGIHNRSHYENVLVTRVHPEYVLTSNLPTINSLDDINEDFWQERFRQINRFEKNLSENGTVIIKFFLNLSKAEQKNRFLERIDNPKKNWKFSLEDVKEREHWDKYIRAYEAMLPATSTKHSPWYVIPADDKWFAHLCISTIADRVFGNLKSEYPVPDEEKKKGLAQAKKSLLAEGKKKKK